MAWRLRACVRQIVNISSKYCDTVNICSVTLQKCLIFCELYDKCSCIFATYNRCELLTYRDNKAACLWFSGKCCTRFSWTFNTLFSFQRWKNFENRIWRIYHQELVMHFFWTRCTIITHSLLRQNIRLSSMYHWRNIYIPATDDSWLVLK